MFAASLLLLPLLLLSPLVASLLIIALPHPQSILSHSQASSALKPESQKGYGEKAKENLDKAAATLQPDSTKSDSQKAGDAISGSDKSDESILDKAKNAVGLGNNNTSA